MIDPYNEILRIANDLDLHITAWKSIQDILSNENQYYKFI